MSFTSPVPGKYSPNLWKDTVITLYIYIDTSYIVIYTPKQSIKPVGTVKCLLHAVSMVDVYVNVQHSLVYLYIDIYVYKIYVYRGIHVCK